MKRLLSLRSGIAAVGAVALTTVSLLLAPLTPVAATTTDRGLFGATDPTYDGVFRQSIAILGLAAGGRDVPDAAVTWLLAQQCDNGAFMSYRVDLTAPCEPGNAATYSGMDTNSTATAAWALSTVGRHRAAARAMRWLVRQQVNGGWAWIGGLEADAFSTGLALLAVSEVRHSAGDSVRAGGRQWLRSVRLTCPADAADRGALRFQPGGVGGPDPLSSGTALAALTITGERLTPAALVCPTAAGRTADTLAAWLLADMQRHGGGLADAYTPGATEWNATAWALYGLANGGLSRGELRTPLRALRAAANSYTKDGTVAAALGALLIVGEATGTRFPQARQQLLATMRT